MKKLVSVLGFMLSVLSLTSCFVDREYRGDYPELLTVAMYSILNTNGYVNESHGYINPKIKILEEDDQGRILFAYCEDQYGTQTSFVIMQKESEGFVYYYPNFNFITKNGQSTLYEGRDAMFGYGHDFETAIRVFSDLDVSYLKNTNDWGLDFNEGKCIKKEISRIKIKPPVKIKEKDFTKISNKISDELGFLGDEINTYRFHVFCDMDKDGRSLYFVHSVHRDIYGDGMSSSAVSMWFYFAVIFQSDGSYIVKNCAMTVQNLYHYQEQILLLKQRNFWNE